MSTEPKAASFLGADLASYVQRHAPTPDELEHQLIAETKALGESAVMQIEPEQGAFLTFITRLVAPSRALEIGTFTGYSSLCIGRGLPPHGRLLCCDIDARWTTIARSYWGKAGLSDRIELRLGRAAETLAALPSDATFELVFIDADKSSYLAYWELTVPRVPPGGVLIVDNVLKRGLVADGSVDDDETVAMRAFNDAVVQDGRVEAMIVPLGDGLLVAGKRPLE